jgi:hypothetical protein
VRIKFVVNLRLWFNINADLWRAQTIAASRTTLWFASGWGSGSASFQSLRKSL